jgi:hypothetical protein
MHIERARLLFDDDTEQVVESFGIRWRLESLLRHEDRDVRDAVATLARSIAAKRNLSLRWEEVACNVCAEASRDGDNRRAIGRPGIRVVDDHRAAGGQGLCDQLVLPALRLPVGPHGVLADKVVGRRKAVAVKRRLAGRGQPDQDYALHVSIARG